MYLPSWILSTPKPYTCATDFFFSDDGKKARVVPSATESNGRESLTSKRLLRCFWKTRRFESRILLHRSTKPGSGSTACGIVDLAAYHAMHCFENFLAVFIYFKTFSFGNLDWKWMKQFCQNGRILFFFFEWKVFGRLRDCGLNIVPLNKFLYNFCQCILDFKMSSLIWRVPDP